jgi:hypothetical protein
MQWCRFLKLAYALYREEVGCEKVEVKVHTYLITALHGGKLASRSGRVIPLEAWVPLNRMGDTNN